MTAPRQILPGTCYLVTRRCTQRQFLLRPSKLVNELVGYLLAVAARRFQVDIHAFCVMSNHIHLIVTDHHARLPAFCQFLNELIARAMNAQLGRWENFWAPQPYSAVALRDPTDIIDKIVYVLANPVAAGLVNRGKKWPGLWSRPADMGSGSVAFQRPMHFFRDGREATMPEREMLSLVIPPGWPCPESFRRLLQAKLTDAEEAAAVEMEKLGRTFLGIGGVLSQRHLERPRGLEPRRGLSPRLAGRDRWRRIQRLRMLREFLLDYRLALRQWRDGFDRVVFPSGTYLMRIVHGAYCAAPG